MPSSGPGSQSAPPAGTRRPTQFDDLPANAADWSPYFLKQVEDQLWTYGFKVLKDAIRTGRIVKMCATSNVPIHMSEEQRRTLHASIEDRDALAVDTLLRAVPYFRNHALLGGGWKPEKGSLGTYFIGCCILLFRDVFKSWASEREGWLARASDESPDDLLQGWQAPAHLDPAVRAAMVDTLRRILQHATPEARAICRLILNDRTYAEIGAELDGLSERAVEGHMRRLRRRVRRLVSTGAIEPLESVDVRRGQVDAA